MTIYADNLMVPQQSQITFRASKTAGFASGGQIKVVPRNPDGSVYDCSAVATASINLATPNPNLTPTSAANLACSVVSADATGVLLEYTKTNLASTFAGAFVQGVLQGSFSVNLYDSGPTLQIGAFGSYQIQQMA
jgi:hypothetical protein